MALVGSILVGVALLIGALNGFRRGGLREGMATIGVLLAVLLALLWQDRWGPTIARRTGWQPGAGAWIVAMALIWSTALLAGYGSGGLLPRRSGKVGPGLRAAGGLLGLLNATLLLGFTLRFTQMFLYAETAQAHKATWIRAAVGSRYLLDYLDLLLLGLGWTLAVVSLVATLMRLIRKLMAPRVAVAPAATTKPAQSSPTTQASPYIGAATVPPAAPGMERSFLDKPRTPGSSG